MPEPQERHYNINRLNILFALASIVLLFSIVAMFADDYSRQWKEYQKKFRALEIEKTRVKYDLEQSKLVQSPEYQTLTADLEKTKAVVAEECSKLGDTQKKLEILRAQNDRLKHNFKIRSAELDAARFRYEEAVHTEHNIERAQDLFQKLKERAAQLKQEIERSDEQIKTAEHTLFQCDMQLRELTKQETNLEKQATLLSRKLRKIDPQEMNIPTYIANLVRDLPVIDFANPNYKIEQIVLKDITDDVNFMTIPKVDRCITCHLGIANPDYENAPQPFRTHPNLELYVGNNSAHPMEEFGCTVCHDGRGRGTDFTGSAHTPSSHEQEKEWQEKYKWRELHHWDNPMYPVKYVEAGCFKCHSTEGTVEGAEKLNLGLKLIERSGCYACHTMDRYKGWPKPGPDLTKLSSKVSREWAYNWIRSPRSFRHNTWMPEFFYLSNNDDPASIARSEQEIHAIVNFLFTKNREFKMGNMATWGDPKKGEELVSSLGCLGCHNIQHEPLAGKRTTQSMRREHGPNLTGLGTKTSKVWLYNWLKEPSRYHPETRMPDLRLTDEEAADIAAFLVQDEQSEFAKIDIPKVDEGIINQIVTDFMIKTSTAVQTETKLAKMDLTAKLNYAGEKLIGHYGCFSCHEIGGFENYKPIGTELTEEGSKAVERLDFGFIDIEHTRQAWFKKKLLDPRIFDHNKVRVPDEKLRMPDFNFTEEEAEAVTTALLGFVKDKPAASKMRPRTPENIFIDQGQMLVKQLNCQGCHLIEGDGAAIQSTVTEWLMAFGGRDESEARAVTTSFSPPNLIGEGKKVHAKWLFEFLHSPTPIRPWLSVRMPTYKFNAGHLNILVKYFNALDKEPIPFDDIADTTMTEEEYMQAEKLFSDEYFGCAKCHIVGDKMPGGSQENWAPDFALAKSRLKPGWIIEWIKDPQALLPGTKMPNFYDPQNYESSGPEDLFGGNEDAQIEALRNYILTLAPAHPSPVVEDKRKQAPAPAIKKPVQDSSTSQPTAAPGSAPEPPALPAEPNETQPQGSVDPGQNDFWN